MKIRASNPRHGRTVRSVLARFPAGSKDLLTLAECSVYVLDADERYAQASQALTRIGIDVDGWPAPPAGLFVVEERCVYVRSVSRMTIAHELGHAIDLALGGGTYFSGTDSRIRSAFGNARQYVTPYAASGLDEYFAESLRAYVEINDAASPWPKADRARLLTRDAEMYRIIEALALKIEGMVIPRPRARRWEKSPDFACSALSQSQATMLCPRHRT